MTLAMRKVIVLGMSAAVIFGAFQLIYVGMYGLTLFVAAPFLIGVITTVVSEPRSHTKAMGNSSMVLAALGCMLLVIKIEGLLCLLMAMPHALVLGAIGASMAHAFLMRATEPNRAAMMLILPLATLIFDVNAKPPVFQVQTEVEIAAPPEKVWKHVIAFPDLPEPTEWYFRSGIAYPKRATIEGSGPGAVRSCEFSTGPFVEPIEVWDQPRLLKFRVTENSAPMNEWSPYADFAPKHLHGYFTSKQGQFRLTPLPGNRTLLEGTTWYQHGLWPAQYWRWWSDAIIHRIHLRVLNHIRALAEQ